MNPNDYNTQRRPTWCPGCGDFGIWAGVKGALAKQGLSPHEFVVVYGVGCSGNMTDFIKSYGFHSLHGRAVPNAEGIKLANHELPVIVVGGDGDLLGEGSGHLAHAARGNHDLTVIIHDNRVYGLTTGQAAPTASKGYKSKSTPKGIIEVGMNPLTLAMSQGATYVARGFAGDIPHLTQLIDAGMTHKGFSVIDVLQPCVTFNKINTYQYYRERVYKLEDKDHDSKDRYAAYKLAELAEDEGIPIGLFYQNTDRPAYHEQVASLKNGPLVKQEVKIPGNFDELLNYFK
ncbi:2-oxoacid ferredoxin oxidoreductase [Candidatus Roizmanbacteria bacterium CG22_combo_CG10-13_8_21_14_all_38_20]|uniref:2-oxoacid ferredoxin oxidoreductase n=1 Tax=Candidatus Roizmanbacteria bacterium CG22_combo_CG10-13_8_21_14_all_38_20 TaxID=1974862 RepID=A0A2H0BVE2_9BACT|nr:2-oxoacid ferredoxin oxidoreductase [Candidatus Microgenomates bacterium]PIP61652.1 MAG: 2-oxoacid ferredoxin oxidoreductase [Candidatus Roizmanbacteria bacterium CG22_combo_CG10-13_8_21_14_all_38_20]PJC30990.1 MAG: 2-oxoacid ferredoxin oxidoreductase [Candidatus Roizmanbacteria bacterium CG_4_9_14_0_2_um_filter_38_17]